MDKLQQANNQAKIVQEQMRTNIENIMERGQNIDLLDDKARMLEEHSQVFYKKSNQISRLLCWKNYRFWIILIFMFIILIVVFLIFI